MFSRELEILQFDPEASRKEPEWIFPGLRAGQVGLLCAPGGTGKSFLALELAFSVAAGASMLKDISIDQAGPVRVLNFEDDVLEMRNRGNAILRLMQAKNIPLPDASDLYCSSLAGDSLPLLDFRGESLLDNIRWLEHACEGMRFVIIDPLSHLHVSDENNAANMTQLVQILKGIALQTQCGMLICHHISKSATLNGQGDVQQAARGSSAIVDACRLVLNLSRDPGSPDGGGLLLTWSKINGHPPIRPIPLVRGTEGVLVQPYYPLAGMR